MPGKSSIPHRARIAAAILLAGLAAGCVRPLAVQHEFFSPLNGSADRIGAPRSPGTMPFRATNAAK